MSVRKLVTWWLGVTIITLLYAGLDAYLHPEVATSTLDKLRFTPDLDLSPLEIVEQGIHAGGRLLGALGWFHFTALAIFVSGFVVITLSLFHKDEDETQRDDAGRTTVLPPL